jgi:hypothetical protein
MRSTSEPWCDGDVVAGVLASSFPMLISDLVRVLKEGL